MGWGRGRGLALAKWLLMVKEDEIIWVLPLHIRAHGTTLHHLRPKRFNQIQFEIILR